MASLRVFYIPKPNLISLPLGLNGGGPKEEDRVASKTVPLRNEKATSKDVRGLLAHMLAVQTPEEYGLFSIIDGKG